MFRTHTDITGELQGSIDRLAASGGGEIIIPPGEYTFRPIALKSHICLTLSAGARMTASARRQDYVPIGYNHNEMGEVHSAIYALNQEDITLRGAGTIDLSGESFYHMDRPTPVATIGPPVTQAYLDEAPRTYDWRVNQPVFFHRCTNIRLDGLTITNAPCWTLSFDQCHIVRATDLTIRNSLVIPNNDGMHFTGSSDILISGCHITAGDDCIALSSITDWRVPCENVVVTHCILQSASKAISIGYMHSIVRNVLIENVIVKPSNRAFVSMVHPHTGLVENVQVANCIFEGRSYGGNWWGNGEAIVLMVTPHHIAAYRDPLPEPRFDVGIRNVSFSHITCRAERPIGIVASKPLIEGVRLSDVTVDIVPEVRPSLKGNVLDLAPGPENYAIPRAGIGIVHRNAHLHLQDVTDGSGNPVEALEID
ncbi:MAG: glycosyl hydrolase family 28 protein [Anaerolineae bacterium]|nr:glycosyl hydrolase family 28 protein [Anaerolineae bacterium]